MAGQPPPETVLTDAAHQAGPHDTVLGIEDLHVTVHDGGATALRGVSLRVHSGEIVGLVGESGSGSAPGPVRSRNASASALSAPTVMAISAPGMNGAHGAWDR